jgi:hypothetical protein
LMMSERPFSARFGHRLDPVPIYEDAPFALRNVVVHVARSELKLIDGQIAAVVRKVLGFAPAGGWDEIQPDVDLERLLRDCDWWSVYDILEALYNYSARNFPAAWAGNFQTSVNEECDRLGIGYEMLDGRFRVRSAQPAQVLFDSAAVSLREAGKLTASAEFEEAIKDLSRRPKADRTGAIQHVGAAIECLARDLCGDATLTLGDIIKKYPHLFPGAYRKLAESISGITSNKGRHVAEGGEPTLNEAMLLVGVVSALANYMIAEAAK